AAPGPALGQARACLAPLTLGCTTRLARAKNCDGTVRLRRLHPSRWLVLGPMTHSEIVHVYYGLGSVALGLSAAWAWRHDRGVARYAWPVLLLLAGASLLLPVETGERRYQIVGWRDTLRCVLPWSFREWLDYVRRLHVILHKTG